MTKIGCSLLGEEGHEDHHCKICIYKDRAENEDPCDKCLDKQAKTCFFCVV